MARGVKAAAKAAKGKAAETAGMKQVAEKQTQVPCGNDKVQKQSKRIMQPAGCRTYMRRRLAKEFPEIVDGFVEEAKKGSCNHVKQAMEMLKPVRKGSPRRKGTAARLLEELSRGREAE